MPRRQCASQKEDPQQRITDLFDRVGSSLRSSQYRALLWLSSPVASQTDLLDS